MGTTGGEAGVPEGGGQGRPPGPGGDAPGGDLPERVADLVGGVTEGVAEEDVTEGVAEDEEQQTGGWRGALASGITRTAEEAARRLGRSPAGVTRTAEEAARTLSRGSSGVTRTAEGTARRLGRGVRAAGRRSRLGSRWLADQVLAAAPRLPIRNQETLRAQFPGKSPEQVADALIDGASRATAAVGAAVGAWSLFPLLPAFPVEVATETLAVVSIEIKMVAELHEVYGMRAPGATADRMTAYVGAWAHRRGVSFTTAPAGLVVAAGSPLRRLLQRRLAARATSSAFALGPLLTGAVAGAVVNRYHTSHLGVDVRNDLRKRSPFTARWPD